MKARITKRTVDAAKAGERDAFIWDAELKRFVLKVSLAGNRIYLVHYRTGGCGSPTRRFAIGNHGAPWTPYKARTEAKRILGANSARNETDAIRSARRYSVIDRRNQPVERARSPSQRCASAAAGVDSN